MFTLAFDTSTRTVSVCLLEGGNIIEEETLNTGRNHSEVLLPVIERALKKNNLKMGCIDLFSCAVGPGSFTGVRIAVSTIKGMMVATGKPAVGVSTLAALALNVEPTDKLICAVIDAERGQVYSSLFRHQKKGMLRRLAADLCLKPQGLLQGINEDVVCVGDGAVKYADIITQEAKTSMEIPQNIRHHIRASAVGLLAGEKYRKGELLNSETCVPVYLRSADVQVKGAINDGK